MKKLHLDDFEDEIDWKILSRGFKYYESGLVGAPKSNGRGRNIFKVKGTELYHVIIDVQGDAVVNYECDCPYDMGPVCKHIVACLYHLREEARSVSRPAKDAGKDIDKRIRVAIRHAKGRLGYVDWSAARGLNRDISEFLDEARDLLGRGKTKPCIDICIPVFESMIDAFGYADDSNGDIGILVHDAYELLGEAARKMDPSDPVRRELLAYCFEKFRTKAFSGWDWDMGMLELAASLAITDAERQVIIQTAEDRYPESKPRDLKNYSDSYGWEDARRLIYSVLLKMSPEKAESYLQKHIDIPEFREAAIKRAIADADYPLAYSLCRKGQKYDGGRSLAGLVAKWREYELATALSEGDAERILSLAEGLWLEDHGDGTRCLEPPLIYYEVLKEYVPAGCWREYIGVLAERLKTKRWSNSYVNLCIREKWWDKLLQHVSEQPSGRTLKEYERYLKADYKDELVALYAAVIYRELEGIPLGRGHYREICSYLRRILKLGDRKRVEEIIIDLKAKYPRRSALIDELNNVL